MTHWSVRVVLEGSSDEPPLDAARFHVLEDAVMARHGTASWLDHSVSISLPVPADSAADAATNTCSWVEKLAAEHGLRLWRVRSLEVSDRDLPSPEGELAGIAEFAAMLRLSPSRASSLTRTPDFPQPVARLAAGPVWRASTLAAFATTYAPRTGRPPKRR